ncbi:hypothetical protein Ae201684P_002992 [Aphanomyces euteiches]|uniref:Uncharacterized protein n=1 Tax=Aphanomyces euteiches TaxID=100861 RepID=A0A6G0X542_9STRA|nr:hypothetical protein Ae201684_008289 [Aphanomyces euteiches]KAH9070636.1 hypothetical protein Ae201684P_002992 [Aphanomyces euteiches]
MPALPSVSSQLKVRGEVASRRPPEKDTDQVSIKLYFGHFAKENHSSLCPVQMNQTCQTLNLDVFQYTDFLDFLVSTVREKSIGVGTLNGYLSQCREKSIY